MSGLKGRVKKLYANTISDVSSEIVVTHNGKLIRKVISGTNNQKVIRLVVRL